jgi:hypothetical protein
VALVRSSHLVKKLSWEYKALVVAAKRRNNAVMLRVIRRSA